MFYDEYRYYFIFYCEGIEDRGYKYSRGVILF